MTIVIDSTITLAGLFEDEATAATEALLDQLVDGDAIVPAVWQLEVTDALIDAESHGRLSEAQAARMLHLLDQLPITVEAFFEATVQAGYPRTDDVNGYRQDPSGDDPVAVHAAARRHNLSAYPASYLVLAERLALPLATADVVLAGTARLAEAGLVASS